jgi:hypothetical protein
MGTGHRFVAISFLSTSIFFVGCGGAPPTPPQIDQLAYDPALISVGKQTNITGSLAFIDDSGDIHELDASIQLPSGQVQPFPPTPVAGVSGVKAGALNFALSVALPVAGRYQLEVWLVDDAGGDSNHLTGIVEAR